MFKVNSEINNANELEIKMQRERTMTIQNNPNLLITNTSSKISINS